jgi:hypothetical protein
MKRWNILILSTCMLFCVLGLFAQNTSGMSKDSARIGAYRNFAYGQIDSLKKQGALIVVLASNSRRIEAYEKAGKKKIADEMRAETAFTNRYLIHAFKTRFSFCPVYFIAGEKLNEFRKGKTSGVFTDSSGKIDANITFTKPFYMIVEYGTVFEIQNKKSDWEPGKFKPETVGNLDPADGSPAAEECLVIKDRQLFQYRFPFPYFAQVKFGTKTMDGVVERLNVRFFNFYQRKQDDGM